jgi:transcriptional regulator with XRE-family HTH domain
MDDQLNAHIGNRLRAARRALSLSQSDLGAMTQIRFRQIHKYETGVNRMSASVLWKFACAMNLPVQYFFDELIERKPAMLQLVEMANDPPRPSIFARRPAARDEERIQQSLR